MSRIVLWCGGCFFPFTPSVWEGNRPALVGVLAYNAGWKRFRRVTWHWIKLISGTACLYGLKEDFLGPQGFVGKRREEEKATVNSVRESFVKYATWSRCARKNPVQMGTCQRKTTWDFNPLGSGSYHPSWSFWFAHLFGFILKTGKETKKSMTWFSSQRKQRKIKWSPRNVYGNPGSA